MVGMYPMEAFDEENHFGAIRSELQKPKTPESFATRRLCGKSALLVCDKLWYIFVWYIFPDLLLHR